MENNREKHKLELTSRQLEILADLISYEHERLKMYPHHNDANDEKREREIDELDILAIIIFEADNKP